VIRISDLAVAYPGMKRRAVDGVSLQAARGRVTAVVGPNGSGKSTLVRALLGRATVERGEIEIDGKRHDMGLRSSARGASPSCRSAKTPHFR
jgi:ABC-type Mn2+/Zn2+ transport system ATPase subunit